MNTLKRPSLEILKGRRALEEISQIKILKDLQWDDINKKWFIVCETTLPSVKSKFIPEKTNWYILISENYPFDQIKFYPAHENGIIHTFQHQMQNSEIDNCLWKNGNICTSADLPVSKRVFLNTAEPADCNNRLKWHGLRAIEWLKAAVCNKLTKAGDPFELPDFSGYPLKLIIFNEHEHPPMFFEDQNNSGTVLLKYLSGNMVGGSQILRLLVSEFRTWDDKIIAKSIWGHEIDKLQNKLRGIWIKLKEVPVTEPWQAPIYWDELMNYFEKQLIDLSDLRYFDQYLKKGEQYYMLIGFPIPKVIGGKSSRMFWQGLQLPGIPKLTGFRRWEDGLRHLFTTEAKRDKSRIMWLKSQNWAQDEIGSRGSLEEKTKKLKYLILGVGALGSVISEMMVRAGVFNIAVMDGELMEIGNLCRHILCLNDLDKLKAEAMAHHLNTTCPNVNAIAINASFPSEDIKHKEIIFSCDAVIDCTAAPEVIHNLEKYNWNKEIHFFSFSVSVGAKRLYAFYCKDSKFPGKEFKIKIEPWLIKDEKENKNQWPREGVGCWHPVFPASAEQIWLMASLAVKFVSEMINKSPGGTKLVIFEEDYRRNIFNRAKTTWGIKRIEC